MIRKTFLNIATPYGAIESINWLIKNAVGLTRRNAGIVKSIPGTYALNEKIETQYKLAFIGDIAPSCDSFINISPEVKEFLGDSDYLIANFEGTITEKQKGIQPFAFDQKHNEKIIKIIEGLFPVEKTYLSLSNNHTGDFGREEFFNSVKTLESHGFNAFGWRKKPYFDINDMVRIVSGTMWSNRSCDYVSTLEDAESHIKPGAFNILFPHFGYELELYPRPEIVEKAKLLVQKFDAVIGHHPHCPQPVTAEEANGAKRLLAYSLGDFSGVLKSKKYQYGLALKAELGRNEKGRWLLGKVQWRLTCCSPLANGDFIVDLRDVKSVTYRGHPLVIS